jgi:uncharacterized membrane-anchored protein
VLSAVITAVKVGLVPAFLVFVVNLAVGGGLAKMIMSALQAQIKAEWDKSRNTSKIITLLTSCP